MDKESFLIGEFHSPYIGDDGAVVGGTIYSMDAFCEDVHFKRAWMSPAQIGRKAMLVNLSDVVAMNATPKYAMVSVSVPREYTRDEIGELVRGLEDTADAFGCEIIGGDTVGGEKLHLSISVISKSEAPLLRSGLREGDLLAYTGTLGESKRDLERLMNGERIAADSRFFEPKLRGEFVAEAREYLHAGMDISDGLYCDTNKLLEYNRTGFEAVLEIDSETGMSGEEYEMLVALSPGNLNRVAEIAVKTGTKLTVFAKVVKNERRYPCRSHHFQFDL